MIRVDPEGMHLSAISSISDDHQASTTCDNNNVPEEEEEKVKKEQVQIDPEEAGSINADRHTHTLHHVKTDPRVQMELENLNTSTDFINKLELELEKARNEFSNLVCDSTQKIESLSRKLGSSIAKARPYYEARTTGAELLRQAQCDAHRFEQASDAHHRAKQVVHRVEQDLREQPPTRDKKLSEEVLTRSADRVNRSELERLDAQRQHEATSRAYRLNEQRLSKLHQQLKRSIVKSSLQTRRNFLDLNNFANQHQLQLLPYFEMKAQFAQMLDEQVDKIRSYEDRVNKAKSNYVKALQRLEGLNSKIYGSTGAVDSEICDDSEQYIPIADCSTVSSSSSSATTTTTSGAQATSNISSCSSSNHSSFAHSQFPPPLVDDNEIRFDENDSNQLAATTAESSSSSLSSSSTSAHKDEYNNRDKKIFDCKLLDQLILDDCVDETLRKLEHVVASSSAALDDPNH